MRNGGKSLWRRLKNFLKLLYYKVMRTSGTPEYIARGVAVGIFISFFMPNMFQTIPALALAFLIRGAKIPAMLITWISNWWTAVFIYPVQCYIGSILVFHPLSYEEIAERTRQAFLDMKTMDFEQFWQLGRELTAAFLAGGLVFGVAAAVPGYFLSLKLVRKYRALREERRKRKMARPQTDKVKRKKKQREPEDEQRNGTR